MKRILLLVLFSLILTGCTVEYNLTIKDNKIEETTIITVDEDNENSKETLYSSYEEEYPIYYDEEFLYYDPNKKIEGNTYYNKSIVETTTGYNMTYKANYTLKNYKRSRALNETMKKYNVSYEDKVYHLIASDAKLLESNTSIKKITVNIDLTDYEVIESNANSNQNNIYTWILSKGNNNTVEIDFQKKDNTTKEENNTTKSTEIKEDYTLYIFFGILLILILIGYLVFKKIKNKDDLLD